LRKRTLPHRGEMDQFVQGRRLLSPTSSITLDVAFGSKLPVRGAIDPRPELEAQPKQITRKRTFALERLKLEVFSPWLAANRIGSS